MAEFRVSDKLYRSDKLNAIQQFHVFRRMGNLFPSVIGALSVKDKDPMLALSYIMTSMSKIPDDDMNFILRHCLGSCRVQQAQELWVDVYQNGQLMFEDITMQDMLEITWHVLQDNFSSFTSALLAKFSAKDPAQA